MMQAGTIPGCVMPDALLERIQKEKKPQRLERAALMAAAVKELGFAGAHIGGFGLTYRDMAHIVERAEEIGPAWRARLDELIAPYPGEFYLLPQGADGLSDGDGAYQVGDAPRPLPWVQRMCLIANRLLIADESPGARFLKARLGVDGTPPEGDAWRHGFWYTLLHEARRFKTRHLGCVGCGDCIQDHLMYAGCTMGRCYKELRNGPCGGSRVDGTCEMNPEQPCVWTLAYQHTLGAVQDPKKFARTLIPPRDWSLNRTESLANRLASLDNYHLRQVLVSPSVPSRTDEGETHDTDRRTD
jgi:methylenetetrahydrofolate reductase (NADPH)